MYIVYVNAKKTRPRQTGSEWGWGLISTSLYNVSMYVHNYFIITKVLRTFLIHAVFT